MEYPFIGNMEYPFGLGNMEYPFIAINPRSIQT